MIQYGIGNETGNQMSGSKISQLIGDLSDAIASIDDRHAQVILEKLLNLIEKMSSDIDKLREENQKLRDENNHLKGEQGKPSIRKQSKDEDDKDKDHSSEKDRKPRGQQKKKKKKRQRKKDKIKIDRVEKCSVDPEILPDDAVFKGYEPVTIQDIKITTDNVKFLRACYYSKSLNKTFMGALPPGYQGEYGPKTKALALELHHHDNMTQSSIVQFLKNHGLLIENATVSRILTDNLEPFHQEKEDIVKAGLASGNCQQMDDTSARVKGKNFYTHVLCNPFYTAFFTRPDKSRLTLLDILMQGNLKFYFTAESYELMGDMGLSPKQIERLKNHQPKAQQTVEEVYALLEELFPDKGKLLGCQKIILEASAIIAYRHYPLAVSILLTDDAPQFKRITELLALCWVHDGRHYKKLNPIVPRHRRALENFQNQYWHFYHRLLDYKAWPSESLAKALGNHFDALFSTKTGYKELDERIEKTRNKRGELLIALSFPEVLLHNNDSELGARVQARYRDISFHTMSDLGTKAKDTFMTLVATAKKLAVNTYQYFLDRVSKVYEMPSLSELITANAQKIAIDSG